MQKRKIDQFGKRLSHSDNEGKFGAGAWRAGERKFASHFNAASAHRQVATPNLFRLEWSVLGSPSSSIMATTQLHPDFSKGDGLLPAIAQDAATGDVLMLAWMNS